MGIQNWSEDITVVELAEDPQLSDEMATLLENLEAAPTDVVLNFAAVSFVNSSNIARLLRLRKLMITKGRRLVLAGVNSQVWGVFLVTGLDKIFEFTNDMATSLAAIQIGNSQKP